MSRDPEIVSFTMSRIRGKDTGIERKLRKRLYQDGYRFLCNSKRAFGHTDFLFPALRLAVFADSEFWHGYRFAENESKLVTHRDYWVSKIKRNMARDAEVNAELQRQGYKVLRFWGFEINKDFERVIKTIEETAERRKQALCLAKRPKEFTTLSYYKHDGRYLLLYRDKKEKDLNKGKYVGIGGHYRYWFNKWLYCEGNLGVFYGNTSFEYEVEEVRTMHYDTPALGEGDRTYTATRTEEDSDGGFGLFLTPRLGVKIFTLKNGNALSLGAGYRWNFGDFKFDKEHTSDYFSIGIAGVF